MTLTPEQIADGWIEHDGGDYPPVEVDDMVFVLLRDGDPKGYDAAGYFDWRHTGDGSDIIAYRLEPKQ